MRSQVKRVIAINEQGEEVVVPLSDWKRSNAKIFRLKVVTYANIVIAEHEIEIGPKGGLHVIPQNLWRMLDQKLPREEAK